MVKILWYPHPILACLSSNPVSIPDTSFLLTQVIGHTVQSGQPHVRPTQSLTLLASAWPKPNVVGIWEVNQNIDDSCIFSALSLSTIQINNSKEIMFTVSWHQELRFKYLNFCGPNNLCGLWAVLVRCKRSRTHGQTSTTCNNAKAKKPYC